MNNNDALFQVMAESLNGKIIESVECWSGNDTNWDGYKIAFVGGEYLKIKISNSQSCCEVWGVSIIENKCNENNENDSWVGKKVNQITMKQMTAESTELFDFANFNINIRVITNAGDFTIIIYNNHNGYYYHEYFIETTTSHIKGRI